MMNELGALTIAVRDEIRQSMGRLSCIHAVGTLIDAAESLGYSLEPITVRGHILNPFLTERVGAPDSPEFFDLIDQWGSHEGACQIGLGMGEHPPGEWAGHLVAVARLDDGRRLILDPTLQQVDQPRHGISFMPLALRVAADRLEGEINSWFSIAGCWVRFRFFPHDKFFLRTTAWRERRDHLVAGALRRYHSNGVD